MGIFRNLLGTIENSFSIGLKKLKLSNVGITQERTITFPDLSAEVMVKRNITESELDSLALGDGIELGTLYFITDSVPTGRLAVGTSASTYEAYAKQSEAGGGGSPALNTVTLTVSPVQYHHAFVTISDASITANHILSPCQLVPNVDFDPDDLADFNLTWEVLAGGILFCISRDGPIVGDFRVTYGAILNI